MGACWFSEEAEGQTAEEAFRNAQADARHWHGHGGYTGTIAEKTTFIMCDDIEVPEGRDNLWLGYHVDKTDPRWTDKWGPAACVQVEGPDEDGKRLFLFFGWASC